mmetsp:Transcript_9893/g.12853  ORF Transcript_9893/g.12853 Transcript_9893/m.12853 type:complete len:228 (+) Transcript_9893:71-754(+)
MKVISATSTLLVIGCASAFTLNKRFSFGTRYASDRTALFMSEELEMIELDVEERMSKSVDSLSKNLGTISTGRANPSMLDRVMVEYFGAPTPLNQLAGVSVPSSSQLQIDAYDKSCLNDIEKALILADLGMTPNNDGSVIRLNIPTLTEERRKDLLKQVKALGEDGKVAVRNVRRDGVDKVKKLEKSSSISEDQSKDGQNAIQSLTDKFVKVIEEVVAKKEKDVTTV